jgi:cell division protein FtsL
MNNLLYIVAVLCAVWVIYDVWANRKSMSTGTKLIWTICALLFSIVTAIIYAVVGKK